MYLGLTLALIKDCMPVRNISIGLVLFTLFFVFSLTLLYCSLLLFIDFFFDVSATHMVFLVSTFRR